MSETPQEYIERIVGNVEGKNALKVQTSTPKTLARLIRGKSAARLRARPAPGKWSVAEILAHLADCEVVTSWRMRQILGAPGAAIQAFDQDAWAAALHYAKRDARKSLAHFTAMREANLALLKSLAAEQWKHFGIHAERGQESIEHILRLNAGHDVNHIKQIERLLAPKKK
jgi:DinB family protein